MADMMLKKGKIIYKKGSKLDSFIFIKEGTITDGAVNYTKSMFVGIIPFITGLNIADDIKTIEQTNYSIYKSIDEIPEEEKEIFLKSISESYLNLMYYPTLQKIPNSQIIINNFNNNNSKKQAKINIENEINLDFDLESEEGISDFINAIDTFLNIEQEPAGTFNLPDSYEEVKELLKNEILSLNVSKFGKMVKEAIDKKFAEEDWKKVINELFELSITINDRAMMLYILYMASMTLNDIHNINAFLKKEWGFLRVNELNLWIDYAIRVLNNKLFLREAEKYGH